MVLVTEGPGPADPAPSTTLPPPADIGPPEGGIAAAQEPKPPDEAPAAPALTYVVEPGDSLWSIAECRVRLAAAGAPETAAVHDYWLGLVEANADRLVAPDNPSLILPGQELVLPG